jgi:ferric-dicitrate binding protein FerR (iron transport regulator)
MIEDHLINILVKNITKTPLSDEETRQLDEWTNASDENARFLAQIRDESKLAVELHILQNIHPQDIWNRLQNDLLQQESEIKPGERRRHVIRLFSKYAAAAAIIVAILIPIYRWQRGIKPVRIEQHDIVLKADLPPASNKATLTLADGSVIALHDSVHGVIARQSGNTVRIDDNGELAYLPSGNNAGSFTNVVNTVRTPNGGKMHLVLPDQTQVWLNAGSAITYPVSFNGGQRRITLEGEAYFDVTADPHRPFFVQTGNTSIAVLGTRFNIRSYKDDERSVATLVSGKISVSANGKMAELKPSRQAVITREGMVLADADTTEATAWKDGIFSFKAETIEGVMREVARWYDVQIEYKGKVDRHFTAVISRDVPLSKLLGLLQKTGSVHFTVNGRAIIVSP